ncbi:MAG: formyltetrahydrofolate deformylase [Spirochaetae bacterium HGW-Spirochaetae-1]|jgi:formyltetrahydrofolate deformylase|nr:MAG: formyltetrahydrofolate deformylase [Spirochaetae bacterium HGW-Spirochaetae-1]
MHTHILLVDCRDEEGLVHRVTGVLYRHNCNIISNGEFVEKETGHFFMRTEFWGQVSDEEITGELRTALPADTRIKLTKKLKKKAVILATREHHCLGDLLLRNNFNEISADILAVISNHSLLNELTEKFGIPFHCIDHEGLSRSAHEERILQIIDELKPEYIILAKYMRVLSRNFVSMFPHRIINIHHSFLPAFIGANPYKKAFDRGVKIIGATAHFVTDDLDEGPIISQGVVPVDHTHSVDDMIRAGREVERLVLAQSLKLVLEDRVFVHNNKTIIFD